MLERKPQDLECLWDESEVGIPKNSHGHILCQYCGERPKLIHDSSEIYGTNRGKIWICWPCKAWVGCHDGSQKPLGRLADRDLRQAKMAAHALFDKLWKGKAARDHISYSQARGAGYKWLAEQMGLPARLCHIGYFDMAACQAVMELCQPYMRR